MTYCKVYGRQGKHGGGIGSKEYCSAKKNSGKAGRKDNTRSEKTKDAGSESKQTGEREK